MRSLTRRANREEDLYVLSFDKLLLYEMYSKFRLQTILEKMEEKNPKGLEFILKRLQTSPRLMKECVLAQSPSHCVSQIYVNIIIPRCVYTIAVLMLLTCCYS